MAGGRLLACCFLPSIFYMGVSENNGIPKSSILIGFSNINHPFWGTPIFGNTHILLDTNSAPSSVSLLPSSRISDIDPGMPGSWSHRKFYSIHLGLGRCLYPFYRQIYEVPSPTMHCKSTQNNALPSQLNQMTLFPCFRRACLPLNKFLLCASPCQVWGLGPVVPLLQGLRGLLSAKGQPLHDVLHFDVLKKIFNTISIQRQNAKTCIN